MAMVGSNVGATACWMNKNMAEIGMLFPCRPLTSRLACVCAIVQALCYLNMHTAKRRWWLQVRGRQAPVAVPNAHPRAVSFMSPFMRHAGVIPIDRLTDVRAPVEAVARRVGRCQLESVYGVRLPAPGRQEDPNRQAEAFVPYGFR